MSNPEPFIKNYMFAALVLLLLSYSAWIKTYFNHELPLLESGQPAALYSNQTNDDLMQLFTSAIDSAKQSILLINYALTDPTIISSLRQKAQQGLAIRVICDIKASPCIDQKLGSEIATIRRIGKGLMHQKILVIDNKMTWLGSANMTTESLGEHGNLVAGLNDIVFAKAITDKALTMNAEGRNQYFPHQNFLIGGQEVELWYLPDDQGAVSRLQELIQTAKKSVRVAMFTWTLQVLAKEVIAAKKRGLRTEVVIDHYSGKGASAKIVKLLKNNGVHIALSPGGTLLHHKFMYIDNKVLVNGSANWTKAAFKQNEDCFLIFHNLNKPQKKCMNALWRTIKKESITIK